MNYSEALDTSNLREWPIITDVDKQAVVAAMNSGLTGIDNETLLRLERNFAEYKGVPHCLGFNGGTAAIHAALYACGVGPGDEVIVPAFSFSGTFMPVLALGAKPVFVDIDPDTYNIDPNKISVEISERTKAVMPVHIHGLMADMDHIASVIGAHIFIIEDACQAHGSRQNGRFAGTIGQVGCFSLNHTKALPAGEGGLLITSEVGMRVAANKFRVFGESLPTDLDPILGRTYRSASPGLNYLLPAMTAALANSQLKNLDKRIDKARLNGLMLDKMFSGSEIVKPQTTPKGNIHTYHKYRLRISDKIDRDALIKAVRDRGVPCGLWQVTPMPLYPIFSGEYGPEQFPNAVSLLDHSIVVGSEKYPLCAQDRGTIFDMGDIIKQEATKLWQA